MGEVEPAQAMPERMRGTRRVAIGMIKPNPNNPRWEFNEETLTELANSIREKGIIQPLAVRSTGGIPEGFELIAGERRWRAAQLVGLHEVPVHILDVSDRESMELALIENIQRADLNAFEEAKGYTNLMDQFGYSLDELAKMLGKSRPYISNIIRLLTLPPQVQSYVVSGQMSQSHARVALSHDDPEAFAKRIIDEGLNVRQAEAITNEQMNRVGAAVKKRLAKYEKDPNIVEVEQRLTQLLGLGVQIDERGAGGELRIRYNSLEQLEGLRQLIER
jgi:ParB family chromosome partitioning protein